MKNENLLSTETILKVHDHMNNLYYFHGWSWEERIAIHPEDPSKDHKYSVKVAIVEDVNTGSTHLLTPGTFAFIRK
jgi:hypothetical protein